MALSSVLSAVKGLILDTDDISNDFEDRKRSYSARFPELTPSELNDLAKILPSQIKTYTSSIFNGELSTLKSHFPITFKVFESHWSEVYGVSFDGFEFTKRLHRARPWRGNTTDYLAQNFVDFIQHELSEFKARYYWVTEISLQERLSLKIRRTAESADLKRGLELSELSALTVEDFLKCSFVVPQASYFQKFTADVVGIHTEYRRFSELPHKIKEFEIFAVGSRTWDNYLRWRTLPQNVFNYLKDKEVGVTTPLSSFAEVLIEAADDSISEEDLFSGFFSLIMNLIEDRVVVVYR